MKSVDFLLETVADILIFCFIIKMSEQMEKENEKLQHFQQWKEQEHIFWQWMVSK